MRPKPACLIVCLALGLSHATFAASPRLALVIGNANYPALPALPNCAASAHTVAAALHRAGIAVTGNADASNGEMGSAIADFAAAAPAAPAAILYICGYTIDYQGRDFVLSANASIDRDSDALTQGIAARSVLGTGARLLLLDLVATPNTSAGTHYHSLPASPGVGLDAAVSTAAAPQGATAFAAAIAAVFAKPDVTLAEVKTGIGKNGGGPGITTSHAAPADPA